MIARNLHQFDWVAILRMTFCLGISILLGFVTWLDAGARQNDLQFAFQMAAWPKAFLQHPTQVELIAVGNDGESQSRILYGYETQRVQWLHFVIDDLPPWTRWIQIIQLSPIDFPVLQNFRYTAYGQGKRPVQAKDIQPFGFLEVQIRGNGLFGRRDPAARHTGVTIRLPDPPAGYQAEEQFPLNKNFALALMVVSLSFGFSFFFFTLMRTAIRFAAEITSRHPTDWSLLMVQHMIPLIFGSVAAMSFALPFNAHSDEFLHVATADFWKKYSLPVYGHDDLVLPTISYYGATYLKDLDLSYILTGKFCRLLEMLFPATTETARIFNLFLGGILFTLICIINKNKLPLMCILFFPQLWYLFSYFNNDAWGLFCGSILVLLSLPQHAPFHRLHLAQLRGREYWKTLTLYAGLLCCIVLSKKNYYVMLIFSCFLTVYYSAISLRNNGFSKKTLAVLGSTFPAWLLVLVTFGIAHTYQLTYFNKDIMDPVQEQNAIAGYRPSDFAQQTIDKNLAIRSQGVSLLDMLFEKEWLQTSIFSLFGQYGWTMYYASDQYYWFMLIIFTTAQLLILRIAIKDEFLSKKMLLLALFSIFILNICLSAWHSWTRDFQPQGRYLLSSFPVFLYLEHEARQRNSQWIRWYNYLPMAAGFLGILCFLIIGMQIDKFVDSTITLNSTLWNTAK